MNLNFSLLIIKKSLITFLHRFHVMIFVVVVLGGTITMVLLFNGVIIRSGKSDGYVAPNASNATYHNPTIKNKKYFKTSDQGSGNLDLSNGRTNPFVE
jgi:hypothetical protein